MDKPVLGIIGGVGPLATAIFMQLVIEKTGAEHDQGNMAMIVLNNPQVPDRTAHILDASAPDPAPELERMAAWLEGSGADFLALPCNTAHYYYDAINDAVSVPVINIMRETAAHIAGALGRGGRVGILATEGTISSGVFQSYLEEAGLEAVVPGPQDQAEIMHIIYGCVKAGKPYDERAFLACGQRLIDEGCSAVIVGCTELSVIYKALADKPAWLYDSLDILAERCVEHWRRERSA